MFIISIIIVIMIVISSSSSSSSSSSRSIVSIIVIIIIHRPQKQDPKRGILPNEKTARSGRIVPGPVRFELPKDMLNWT